MAAKKTGETNHKARKDSKRPLYRDERFRLVLGTFLIILSLYLFLAMVSYLFTWKVDQSIEWGGIFTGPEVQVENWSGKAGAFLANTFIHHWFGLASFSFPFLFLLLGLRFLNLRILRLGRSFRILLVGTLLLSLLLGYLAGTAGGWLGSGPGGRHGHFMSLWLNAFMGKTGTAFLLFILFLGFALFSIPGLAVWVWNHIFRPAVRHQGTSTLETGDSQASPAPEFLPDGLPEQEEESYDVKTLKGEEAYVGKGEGNDVPEGKSGEVEMTVEKLTGNRDEMDGDFDSRLTEDYDPTLELSKYQPPPLHLLDDHRSGNSEVTEEELISNKNKIVDTLANYKIQIDKIKATIGPAVTLYEIVPAPGVRISKIKNLEDDIALNLSALGIRIIAPIPGRGTIGIEVPNLNPEIVSMRTMIGTRKFQETTFDLPIALGKTISNETFMIDLAKMPHILVAGATGQGKSVGLNVIITSLLYRMHPSQLKFIFIDPKKVELTLYSRLDKHFIARLPDSEEPIITDTQSVIHTLNSLTIEMDHRYNLLKQAQVRNINEYNKKFTARRLNPEKGHRFMPYIVLVIDEFADLIMTAGREVETPLTRLAQLARAIGIHLIIATQRPTINIITGVIKANFPARIAFRVMSMIDSRTILDSPGANQLVGRGDMLLLFGSDLIRLQCAFIDTPEIDRITQWVESQQGYPTTFYLPEYSDATGDGDSENLDPDKRDSMFEEAARVVVMHQQGSTSLIQRKLSIGYNRAGRIIDQLEATGIVGPFEGSKARRVLISDEYSLEQFLRSHPQE